MLGGGVGGGVGLGEGPGDMECILAGEGASEGVFDRTPYGTGRNRWLSCMGGGG